MDNALKYSDANGQVEVSVICDEHHVIIDFMDKGIGISTDDVPRIFDRFYRCDQSRSKAGIGLGLSLTKAIAKTHDGKISVKSKLNEGSVFTVSFPR